MNQVLVTGGAGFIGSHLVDSQLAQGQAVRVIDIQLARLSHLPDHPQLQLIQESITNGRLLPQLVQQVDTVFHLASAHLDVTLSESHYEQINVKATRQLLESAHQAGVRRFVYCSTNSVLGQIDHPPADENTVGRPTNIYEKTKLDAEKEVIRYHQETGFPVVVIRPSWVYGPRCPRTARLMRAVGKRRFVMFGSGSTLRQPLFVSDAVNGLELAARAPDVEGQVYFIAGAEAVTISQLVQMMADVQGTPPPFLRFPLWSGQLAASLLELVFKPLGRQPPVSQRSLDFYTKDNAYDIGKARRDLGFQPQIDLRAGLELTLVATQQCETETLRS